MTVKTILPPTYLLIAIVMMVALHCLVPAAHIIPFPWNLLGVVPFTMGCLLNVICHFYS